MNLGAIILIIGLVIGVIIGFIIGVFFVSSEDIEFVINNNPLSTYDCAKNYDKWRTFMETDKNSDNYPNQSSMDYAVFGQFELMENRCFITVKSWAHASDFEQLIWGADWKKESYINQIYLEESPCEDPMMCDMIKESRDQYWDYLKSKETTD